jgi:hypothetical protein
MLMRRWALAPDVRLALWLGMAALGVYLATSGGHTYSPDEEERYYVARGLVEQRSLAVTIPTTAEAAVAGDRLVDGANYSKYGLGGSLVALPFYLAGAAVSALVAPGQAELLTRAAVTVPAALATAATVGVLALLVLRLGLGRRAAIGLALLYGLATIAWVYAKTSFVEPVVALALTAAVLVARSPPSGGRRRELLIGAWLGLCLLCRLDCLVLVPWVGIYALAAGWGAPSGGTPRSRWLVLAAQGVRLALGPAVALCLTAAYNWARFGSPLETGYGAEAAAFGTPWRLGLLGLLLSPGRGLLWFAPPVLLAIAGARRFARVYRAEALLVAAVVGSALLFFARWGAWHGGGGYGPRLLLPVLPLLLLPAASALAASGGGVAERWSRRLGIAAVVGLALLVIPPGVAIHFGAVSNAAEAPAERSQLFDPRAAPAWRHWVALVDTLRYWARFASERDAEVVFLEGLEIAPAARAGSYLPAWTAPTLRLRLVGPAEAPARRVTLLFRAHRPSSAPPLELSGWFDHGSTDNVRGERGEVLSLELVRKLEAAGVGPRPDEDTLTVAIRPWLVDHLDWHPGPLARGVLLEAVEVDGQVVQRYLARTPPPPQHPRLLFSWFWHPGLHHLDVWWWYALVAGAPRWLVALLLAGCLALAAWGARRVAVVGAECP